MSSENVNEYVFTFTDKDFQIIQNLIKESAGISIQGNKKNMVYARLVRRIRALELKSFQEYFTYLTTNEKEELGNFVNSLTTNLSFFYREKQHFEKLADNIASDLIKKNNKKELNIWSAGCSTGQEPYSIAHCLLESLPKNITFKITATDIDSNVLNTASEGVYKMDAIEDLPENIKREMFLKGTGKNKGFAKIQERLKKDIEFKTFNLIGDWDKVQQKFDIIFCRNVLIYFEKNDQLDIVSHFYDCLNIDGVLFLGHSESIPELKEKLNPIGPTIFKRMSV